MQSPGPIHDSVIRPERFARDKHSSLFYHFVDDEEKSFVTSTPSPDVIKPFKSASNKLEFLCLVNLSSLV